VVARPVLVARPTARPPGAGNKAWPQRPHYLSPTSTGATHLPGRFSLVIIKASWIRGSMPLALLVV